MARYVDPQVIVKPFDIEDIIQAVLDTIGTRVMTDPCAHCDTRTVPLFRLPSTMPRARGPFCWMCFIRLTPRAPQRSDRVET